MAQIRIPRPEERPDHTTIKQIIEEVNRLGKITVGAGINMTNNASGVSFTLATKPVVAGSSTTEPTGGIPLELAEVWNTGVQYRLAEHVCYAIPDSIYYNIYECIDSTATSGDIPDESSKWQVITSGSDIDLWAEGTYTSGQSVRYGSTYQESIYVASAETSGNPTTSGWTKSYDVVYGIKEFPPLSGTTEFIVPFYTLEQTNSRYNMRTHELQITQTKTTYNKAQKLAKKELLTKVIQTTAVPDEDT